MTLKKLLLPTLLLSMFSLASAAEKPILAPAARIGIPMKADFVKRHGEPVVGASSFCNGTRRTLVLMTPRVQVGDPILFRMVVERDKREKESQFFSRISLAADYSFFIAPPAGGQGFYYDGGSRRADIPFTNFDFTGGDYFTVDFWLLYDRDSSTGTVAEVVGDYMVRCFALCRDGEGKEVSEINFGDFAITTLPASEDNLHAMEMLQDLRLYGYLQAQAHRYPEQQRSFTEADAALFQQIVDEAPNAGIAAHLLYVLADYQIANNKVIEGIGSLQRIRDDYPASPMYEPAAGRLLELFFFSQRDDYAVPIFRDLWTDPDRTRVLLATSPMYQTYVEPMRVRMGSYWNLFEEPGPDPQAVMDTGVRFELSEEVQQMLGLPENVTQEDLERAGINIGTPN